MAAHSPRARRGVTLIVLAVAVIGGTAIYYLRPSTHVGLAQAAPSTRPYSVQRAGDIVFYNFVSLAVGWAAVAPQPHADQSGMFSVFKTVDGGKHWRKQFSGRTMLIYTSLFTFQFVDADHGFVVSGDPHLALNRTTDGGQHWARLELPSADPVKFQFTDPIHLWLFTRALNEPFNVFHPYASSDAGETWTARPDVPVSPYPVFRNGDEGWAGSASEPAPRIYLTTDGGRTWERRDLPIEKDTPQPVATVPMLLPRTGAVVMVYPLDPLVGQFHSYSSMDGGRSWRAITPAGPAGGQGLQTGYAFWDPTHWWSIQDGVLYKTANAGLSWAPMAVEPHGLRIIRAFDDRRAWAQLDEGYGVELLSTADGGLRWTRANVPVAQ